jgi:hypothetical protein
MFTDNGTQFDNEAVCDVLRRADVLTVGFAAIAERLLIDFRGNQWEGPLVAIVGPVQTVQERYAWLGKHRGSFGAPEGFSFFVWPHAVRSLKERGFMEIIRDRLASVSTDAEGALNDTLAQVEALEREAWRQAIMGGEGWHTLWEAHPTGATS